MLVTEPPFREVWCTYMTQMTGVDEMLYKASREVLVDDDGEEDEGIWTTRMEAEFRVRGYRQSKGKQKMRRYCEGGFTLGAMVDVVREMFERDEKAEWVVLESVRKEDACIMRDG